MKQIQGGGVCRLVAKALVDLPYARLDSISGLVDAIVLPALFLAIALFEPLFTTQPIALRASLLHRLVLHHRSSQVHGLVRVIDLHAETADLVEIRQPKDLR